MSKYLDKIKWYHVALIFAVVYYFNEQHKDDDTPVDHRVVKVAQQAIKNYALEFAAQRLAMADALDDGDVTTDHEYSEWFDAHLDEGFENALSEIAELEQNVIGRDDEDDRFDVNKAAAFCKAVAEGFEKAAEDINP